MDGDVYQVLTSYNARTFLGFEQDPAVTDTAEQIKASNWTQFITQRISEWPQPKELLAIGNCTFDAFLQTNVTGPPLTWTPSSVVFPPSFFDDSENGIETLQKRLIASLSIDGEAIYQLTPSIELFWLTKHLLNSSSLSNDSVAILARLRVNFWHQRLLSDVSPTLQQQIYDDLALLEGSILTTDSRIKESNPAKFLVERASIHLHHGFDAKAREDLMRAAKERSFDFALTGRLGKKTKFQEKPLSQLVVLAKSAESQATASTTLPDAHPSQPGVVPSLAKPLPRALDLNDDTLLETTEFTSANDSSKPTQQDDDLPPSLQSLDPANQPLLEPLDAIILLAIAASITNTSPTDGLTREETLPYAERVIAGGSSNWQIYTQALLVRSRIEGYKTRTIERGVLQLQTVVDQVIAETTSTEEPAQEKDVSRPIEGPTSSFLPQPKRAESAPVSERLQFIHQLASPPRWNLESELANRWVSLGGLRTALEIYERLEMWAEAALCWAANDREDKARKIIRRQLYSPKTPNKIKASIDDDEDNDVDDCGVERNPLPGDAPRLFCVLGDIEKSVAAYERAWEVSNRRYARAQRSLGKHHLASGDLSKADEAYSESLKVNPQNHSTWFALGCVRLRTEDWAGAVNAFGRAVEIEDTDAESWSNLAVALLRLPPDVPPERSANGANDRIVSDCTQDEDKATEVNSRKYVRQSFLALKRAAALKRDSFRIWQNLLSVSVQLSPPPYTDIVIAQTRLIDLLGKLEGEKCVDIDVMEALVAHLVVTSPSKPEQQDSLTNDEVHQEQSSKRTGLEKMIIDLVQKKITPLITSARRLWLLTAKLALHLGRPSAALASYEKAWRVTLNQPEWESGGGAETVKNAWRKVSESTIDLADAYESLGERKRESGMGAGELVAKDWKFKARSAVRSVLARGKEGWQGDEKYEVLSERLQELKTV